MVIEQLLPLLGSFRGQTVVVTGASSGIGRITAETFGRLGASVALLARRRTQLEETAAAVEKAGGRALTVACDVTDRDAVASAFRVIKRRWKRVDTLVNNAGILLPSPIARMKVADLEAMLRVNLTGALLTTQAALPGMLRQGHGSIINVASLAGRRGVTPLGGYCASKFALVGLTEALRSEVGGSNLHVGLVLPGVVETAMVQGLDQVEVLPNWPSMLNMPPEWVAGAIVLAVRFRLREISVPPGAATLELMAALSPVLSDTIVSWAQSAGRWISRNTSPARPQRARRA